jgi:hypothetical protein
MSHLDPFLQVDSNLLPTNDNPQGFVSDVKYIKGAPQLFTSIAELVAFHPYRMIKGMAATVSDWPDPGSVSTFILKAEPGTMVDDAGDSIVTLATNPGETDNWTEFWELQLTLNTALVRVRQYATDGLNGGSPTFPYTVPTEGEWENTFIVGKHRWMRMREDSIDVDAPIGVFDNWTNPIPIGNIYQGGDYLDKRYKREGLKSSFGTTYNSTSGLISGDYYIIEEDDIQITGNLALADIGINTATGTATLTVGRTFKYVFDPGITYDFAYGIGTGVVRKTIKVPPRSVEGKPNNNPSGWQDTPYAIPDTDQLWEITGQKSIYGQLKSDWVLKKIIEDPNLTRYANSITQHPDNLCSTNEDATTGSAADLRLVAAGWVAEYEQQVFIAQRTEISPGLYTNWVISKISEESGEYVDRVFKLFDSNLRPDIDAPIQAPTQRDPTLEGWSDTPLAETTTQINYVSEARKFFDGNLKSAWSTPVPYTGQSVFSDTISATPSDNFFRDTLDVITPTTIRLTAKLYKGLEKVWETFGSVITYKWFKVYDGGVAVTNPTQITSTNPADDVYLETVTGSGTADGGGNATVLVDALGDFVTKGVVVGSKIWNVTKGREAVVEIVAAGQLTTSAITGDTWAASDIYFLEIDGYLRQNQVLVIKPGGIDGQASFRVEQELEMSPGNVQKFSDEISILDISDGKDAQTLSMRANTNVFVYDTVGLVFAPAILEFNAYSSNIISPTYYFYRKDGLTWTKLYSPSIPTGYIISGSTLQIDLNDPAVTLFAENDTAESKTFAVALEDVVDPTVLELREIVTVAKLGSANVGSPGETPYVALLSNEAQSVVLDIADGLPFTGEEAKAVSRISLYYGQTKLNYNAADFTTTVAETTYFEIFDPKVENPADTTGDAGIRLKAGTWVNGIRSYIGNITILVNGVTITKTFSLSSVLDAEGAFVLDIDSNKGYDFTPTDKTAKTFTANLYDTKLTGTQIVPVGMPYEYTWQVGAGSETSLTIAKTTTINRANILSSGVVIARAYKNGVLFRERRIVVSDVVDNKSYRAFTPTATVTTALALQNPTTDFIGAQNSIALTGNTWYLSTSPFWTSNQPYWAQDAYEDFDVNPVIWKWTAPYLLKGEKGDQGLSGTFRYPMYKSTYYIKSNAATIAAYVLAPSSPVNVGSIIQLTDGTLYFYTGALGISNVGSYTTTETPPEFGAGSNGATLSQMAGGSTNYTDWLAQPAAIGVIWRTEREYRGQDVTFPSGLPSYSPAISISDPLFNQDGSVKNTVWSRPTRLTATDGRQGTAGISVTGPAGPGYNGLVANYIDGNGDRVVTFDGINGAADVTTTIPKGPTGSPVIFGAGAVIVNEQISSSGTFVDSASQTRSSSWLNSTGYNVWVRIEAQGAAYNNPGDGMARLNMGFYLDGVFQSNSEVSYQYYPAGSSFTQACPITTGLVYVPNGVTLQASATIWAVKNSPNFLKNYIAFKMFIIA